MYALIIDDSRAMRRIIGTVMSALGFELLEAGDGQAGLTQLEQHGPDIDVVLVDWNMPLMNGLEFVQAARAREEFRDTLILMVTNETAPARMGRALLAGVDEFVRKPFPQQLLVEKLRLVGVRVSAPVTPAESTKE